MDCSKPTARIREDTAADAQQFPVGEYVLLASNCVLENMSCCGSGSPNR
jgi:hypothetical protein